MKNQLLGFVLLSFKQNLIDYWNYVYGILVFIAVGFFIWWAFEIAGKFKEDQSEGKKAMQSFFIAFAFAFGIILFMKDILEIFGVDFPDID